MQETFVMYKSFHDAMKILSREQYCNVMYAINEYAFYGIEAELSDKAERAVFTIIKPIIDANSKKREGGKKGGRPKKKPDVIEEEKPVFFENDEEEKPVFFENDEEEKPVFFENDEEEKPVVSENDIGALQKDLFEMITEHNKTVPAGRKVPISGNFISFIQKESRELLDAVNGESADSIRAAMRNFLLVAKSDTWRKYFTFKSFLKSYSEFKDGYFDLDKYLNKEDDDRRPEDAFYISMMNEDGFDKMNFRKHKDDWLVMKPKGDDFWRWQKEWEERDACREA